VAASRLRGFRKDEDEEARILETAERFGIDARFLAALREAENGGPGREFGVLSVSAPTYEEQATIAARTIANTMNRYRANFADEDPVGPDGRLTDAFIRYFSSGGPGYPGYAPLGAGNDPTNLNQYHVLNLTGAYRRIDVVEA